MLCLGRNMALSNGLPELNLMGSDFFFSAACTARKSQNTHLSVYSASSCTIARDAKSPKSASSDNLRFIFVADKRDGLSACCMP